MSFTFGDEPLNRGESVGLQCLTNKGDLPINFRWTIDGSIIISGENSFTITKLNSRTSSLSIEYVDGIHRGMFKCFAENIAGTAELSARLDVNG